MAVGPQLREIEIHRRGELRYTGVILSGGNISRYRHGYCENESSIHHLLTASPPLPCIGPMNGDALLHAAPTDW